jgi:hypothetical protein
VTESRAETGSEASRLRPTEPLDLVNLDEAAAMVKRSKRTLEHYKSKPSFPQPTVEGGGGRPDLWDWKAMRLWLEQEFGMNLPEDFPGSRIG